VAGSEHPRYSLFGML